MSISSNKYTYVYSTMADIFLQENTSHIMQSFDGEVTKYSAYFFELALAMGKICMNLFNKKISYF